MIRYEALLLAVPTLTRDEAKTVESQLDQAVKAAQGTLISFERWGKYRLAYPIKKNDYGVYFLARFEVEKPGSFVEDLTSLMAVKMNETVMRSMISQLDADASLAYQRPQSLEEVPTEKVSFFDRSNQAAGSHDEETEIDDQEEIDNDEEN